VACAWPPIFDRSPLGRDQICSLSRPFVCSSPCCPVSCCRRLPASSPRLRKVRPPPRNLPGACTHTHTCCASGLRVLTGADALEDELSASRAYNEAQMHSADVEEGKAVQVLVTSDSSRGEDRYLEPRTATVVTFDHVRQQCTACRPAEAHELAPEEAESLRRVQSSRRSGKDHQLTRARRLAVQSELEAYLREVYSPHGQARFRVDGLCHNPPHFCHARRAPCTGACRRAILR